MLEHTNSYVVQISVNGEKHKINVSYDTEGAPHIAVTHVCNAFGIVAYKQTIKQVQSRFRIKELLGTMSDGRERALTCIHAEDLRSWLMGLHLNKVNPKVREQLREFQDKYFEILRIQVPTKTLSDVTDMLGELTRSPTEYISGTFHGDAAPEHWYNSSEVGELLDTYVTGVTTREKLRSRLEDLLSNGFEVDQIKTFVQNFMKIEFGQTQTEELFTKAVEALEALKLS